MNSRGIVALQILLLSTAASAEPVLTVLPKDGVFDAPFEVTLEGVPPNQDVVIQTMRATDDGTVWTTRATYESNENGIVKAAKQPSIAGSYTGLSPHGLLCSALPEGTKGFSAYIDALVDDPKLSRTFPAPLHSIPITLEASIDGKVIATATAMRGHAVDVVKEQIATDDGLRGLYFAPKVGKTIREPVLLLNGSGGGVRTEAAARLASHGHPTFAFAIYNYADLPTTLRAYPIERLRDGARWLAQKAGTTKVAIMGVSRGSEAAAHAAIHFPDAFSAVILSVPSHLQDAGALGPGAKPGDGAWTIGGKPLPVTDLGFPFDDPRVFEQAKQSPGYNATSMVLSFWGSEEMDQKYGTHFEKIKAPVLVLSADEDGIWPSWISAERIKQRFEGAGKGNRITVQSYAGAGHSMVAVSFGGPLSISAYNPFLKGFMDFGGTPNGNCEAGFESSQATTEFLSRIPLSKGE